MRTRGRAFTLVELLVVIAIILTLLAILLPSMGRAIFVANEAVCASNMRQIVTCHNSYAVDNLGAYYPNNDGHPYYARYRQTLTEPSLFRKLVQEQKYFATPDIMVCPLLVDLGIPDLGYPSFATSVYGNWRYAYDNPTSSVDVWSGYGWMGGMTTTYAGLQYVDPRGSEIVPLRMTEANGSNYLITHRILAWGAGLQSTTDDSHGGVGRVGTVAEAPPESFKTVRNPVAFGDASVLFFYMDEIEPRISDDSGQRVYYW